MVTFFFCFGAPQQGGNSFESPEFCSIQGHRPHREEGKRNVAVRFTGPRTTAAPARKVSWKENLGDTPRTSESSGTGLRPARRSARHRLRLQRAKPLAPPLPAGSTHRRLVSNPGRRVRGAFLNPASRARARSLRRWALGGSVSGGRENRPWRPPPPQLTLSSLLPLRPPRSPLRRPPMYKRPPGPLPSRRLRLV